MKWTNEQERAIGDRGNLLVSAAAGSGKTAVLTERIVKLICEGTDISEFLVVTFTKAAAEVMKKRIEARLMSAAEETDDTALKNRLRQQASLSRTANISTLHAFLNKVLTIRFCEAGIDPNFRIADESETAALHRESFEEALERAYTESNEETFRFVEALGDEDTFRNIVKRLYGFMRSRPEYFEWLKSSVDEYDKDGEALENSAAVQALLAHAKEETAAAMRDITAAANALSPDQSRIFAKAYSTAQRLEELCAIRRYDAFTKAFCEFEFDDLRDWKRGTPEAEKIRLKTAWERAKKLRDDYKMIFCGTVSDEADTCREMAPTVHWLFDFMCGYDALYTEKKEKEGVLDYSDLEHGMLRVLDDESVCEYYRDKLKYIFVDEYQDSNLMQERIIERIKREDNLFMVGDVKQSIYRFRLADPKLFLDKFDRYGSGNGGKRIDLNANFRSSSAVIEAVNTVFSSIMHSETGDVDYDEHARLVKGREDMGGSVELHVLSGGAKKLPGAQKQSDSETEAVIAAQYIRRMMEQEECIDRKTNAKRKYRYSDFAVLCRKNETAKVWLKTLALEGIPAYAEQNGGYFDAIEVQILLNILRVTDNRRQDIPLISMLRSPIGSFSTKELAELEMCGGGCCWKKLETLSARESTAGKKAKRIVELVTKWRKFKQYLSINDIIGAVLADTGYHHFVSALPGGSQRNKNIEALSDLARRFEQNGNRGLGKFLSHIDRLKSEDKIGTPISTDADVVRIMTLHKSKGLEFPIVILSGLGGKFNYVGNSSDIELDDRLGIGVKDVSDRQKKLSIIYRAIQTVSKRSLLAEEMRLLYVGMTRAEEHLCMIGSLPANTNAEKRLLRDSAPVSEMGIRKATNYLDWLLNVFMNTSAGNGVRNAMGLEAVMDEKCAKLFLHERSATEAAAWGGVNEKYIEWTEQVIQTPQPEKDERYDGLEWNYIYGDDIKVPSKLTVTRMVGHSGDMPLRPCFLQDRDAPTYEEKGSAMHTVMQHIGIRRHDEASVIEQLGELIRSGVISKRLADTVDAGLVVSFFDSELGRRMTASDRVCREWRFNYFAKANEHLGINSGKCFIMQGAIDCCFIEDGEWVIVDYKTDRIKKGGTAEETAMRHRSQIELYKEALSKVTGIGVKEAFVYLVRSGDSVRMP